MKLVLCIGSYVLALAIGVGLGLYLGFRFADSRAFAHDMLEAAHYAAFAEVQMREGDDAAYEDAIRVHLALLEKRKENPNPLFTESVYAFDAALDFARLAALARKRGAEQEGQEYLARAVSLCPQLRWRECSADKIIEVAQRLDKRGLFATKATQ